MRAGSAPGSGWLPGFAPLAGAEALDPGFGGRVGPEHVAEADLPAGQGVDDVGLGVGRVEEAAKGTVRQTATLNVGISDEKAREIGKFIKGLGLKGVNHQVQGQQLRVSGKKKDDLQTAIQKLRESDFGIPLQFTNFRD